MSDPSDATRASRHVRRARRDTPGAVARELGAGATGDTEGRSAVARVRCLVCSARTGTPCTLGLPGANAFTAHAMRVRRHVDLLLVQGCAWCRRSWRRIDNDTPGAETSAYLLLCAAGHLHGACRPCGGAIVHMGRMPRRLNLKDRVVSWNPEVPCPARTTDRALVLLARLGQGAPSR